MGVLIWEGALMRDALSKKKRSLIIFLSSRKEYGPRSFGFSWKQAYMYFLKAFWDPVYFWKIELLLSTNSTGFS